MSSQVLITILAAALLIFLFFFILLLIRKKEQKKEQEKAKKEKEQAVLNNKISNTAQIIFDEIKDIDLIPKALNFIASYEKELKTLKKNRKRWEKEYNIEQSKNFVSKLWGGKKRKEAINNKRIEILSKIAEYETENSTEYKKCLGILEKIDISFYNENKSSVQKKYGELISNRQKEIEKENTERQRINEERIRKHVYSKRIPQMIGRLEEYVIFLQKHTREHTNINLESLRYIENSLDEIRAIKDYLDQKDMNKLETCSQKIMFILKNYRLDEMFQIDIRRVEELFSKIIDKVDSISS